LKKKKKGKNHEGSCPRERRRQKIFMRKNGQRDAASLRSDSELGLCKQKEGDRGQSWIGGVGKDANSKETKREI